MYIFETICRVLILVGILMWGFIPEISMGSNINKRAKKYSLKRKNSAKETKDSTLNEMVKIGSIVTIFDKELCEKYTYKIVAETRNATRINRRDDENELTYDSALGKALIAHSVGDCVTVQSEEKYEVEIIGVDNSAITTKTNQRKNSRVFLEVINDGFDSYEYYGMPPDDFDD